MTTLSAINEGAMTLVRAAVGYGTRSGAPLRMQNVKLRGKQANMQSILDYAVRQGWIRAIPQNGTDYVLTDLGFAVGQ